MNILLIEDDEISSTAISEHLKQNGHHVYLAENGKSAIDVALDHSVDLIICDLMLPVISGISFLRLREKFMRPNVPVITISSLENGEEVLKTMQEDYHFFLQKPFEMEKLLTLIKRIHIF